MATTYDLIVEAHAISAAIETEEQDDEALFERFKAWIDASGDKFARLHAARSAFLADAAYLKAEAARLTERRRAFDRLAGKMSEYATDLLAAHEATTGESKIRTAAFTVYLASSERLEGPEDVNDWPAEYQNTITRPDKAGAKAALKAGQEIPGFELVKSRSVRFK